MLARPPKVDRCQRDGQMMVGRLPDLTDPATLGCLLALVREAWGKPVAVWYPKSTETCCVGVGRMPIAQGRFWQRPSKVAALVAALEAAEGRK